MKKVLIGIMLLSLLVGCGGIKKYSQHEKDDLIIEVYDFGDEVVNTKAPAMFGQRSGTFLLKLSLGLMYNIKLLYKFFYGI